MTMQAPAKEEAVKAGLRKISHIATLPEITLKIITLVENPDSTAQDLHRIIRNDPALCSRILKVVNSAFYGLPGQIGSIDRAIVLLGLNAVKNIAIAASLAKLFGAGSITPGFAARDLWRHSVATAVASKMLAQARKLAFVDEAFLAGLMHDIGIIVEIQSDRQKLIEVVCAAGGKADGQPTEDMLRVEERIFGANHQEFGRGLCEQWKFPRAFALVTGHHHEPLTAPAELRTMPTIVCVADRLAGSLPGEFRLDLLDLTIPTDLLDELQLTGEQIESIREQLPEAIEEMAQMLGGDAGAAAA